MREIRSYGSVRGVAGDRYPYRDSFVLGSVWRSKNAKGRQEHPIIVDRIFCLFLCLQFHSGNWLCFVVFAIRCSVPRPAAGWRVLKMASFFLSAIPCIATEQFSSLKVGTLGLLRVWVFIWVVKI